MPCRVYRPSMRAPAVFALPLALVALAACGSEDADAPVEPAATTAPSAATSAAATTAPATTAAAASTAPADSAPVELGNALRAADAVSATADGDVVTVEAALIDGPAGPVMCDATTRSLPPQCVGDALRVEGLDVLDAPGVRTDGGVAWVAGARVTGTMAGGVLTGASFAG